MEGLEGGMKRFFAVAVVALFALALFAVLGESLPEGSMLRGVSDSLRSVGDSIARGFGGGYGELARP